METQFQIFLFIICLNVATAAVVELGTPGTGYVAPSRPDTGEYASHFNATEMADEWGVQNPTDYLFGDIFGIFNFIWRCFKYLFVGFPEFLNWIGDSMITDAATRSAWVIITAPLYALFGITVFIFIAQFVSGRIFHR